MVFIPSTYSRIISRVSSRIWCGAMWCICHLRANSVVWLSHTSSIWPWSGMPKVWLYNTFLGGLRQKVRVKPCRISNNRRNDIHQSLRTWGVLELPLHKVSSSTWAGVPIRNVPCCHHLPHKKLLVWWYGLHQPIIKHQHNGVLRPQCGRCWWCYSWQGCQLGE